MKTITIILLLTCLVGVAGAGGFTVDNTVWKTFRTTEFNVYSFMNPKNTCLKFSFGDNKFSVCGIDNASKIMVDDCATIGFVHAWKEEAEQIPVETTNSQGWMSDGFGNKTPLGGYSYTEKRTRRCLNCTVVEEEYNEVTPKWRRK
jgi:hypothetical protein